MSWSNVYFAIEKEKVFQFELIEELQNAHGLGPVYWSAIGERYATKKISFLGNEKDPNIFNNHDYNLVVASRDSRLQEYEAFVLLLTTQGAVVLKETYQEAIEYINSFLKDYEDRMKGYVNHLPFIRNLLQNEIENPTENVVGICFDVHDDLDFWVVEESESEDSEEENIEDPAIISITTEITKTTRRWFQIGKDTGAFSVVHATKNRFKTSEENNKEEEE